MPKQLTRKQRDQQRRAADKRHAKQLAHEAMLARHAERRAEVAIYNTAYAAYVEAGCTGPMPIHPHRYIGGVVERSMDADAGTADLIAAADELGIDLSGVKPE